MFGSDVGRWSGGGGAVRHAAGSRHPVVNEYRSRALRRAELYSWEAVTDQYEQMLRGVCHARGPGLLPEHLLHRDPVAA